MSSENLSASDNPSAGVPPPAHGDVAHMATDDPHAGSRAVVFPEAEIREEKIAAAALRPKGVEMKRTLTQEEKDLAAAGYDHLRPKDEGDDKVAAADITEHQLSFEALGDQLKTHFDTKEPDHSHGLTSDEAKLRLQRDGANVLTPPKKKSAFRKVCF